MEAGRASAGLAPIISGGHRRGHLNTSHAALCHAPAFSCTILRAIQNKRLATSREDYGGVLSNGTGNVGSGSIPRVRSEGCGRPGSGARGDRQGAAFASHPPSVCTSGGMVAAGTLPGGPVRAGPRSWAQGLPCSLPMSRHPRRGGLTLERVKGQSERIDIDVVEKRGEPVGRVGPGAEWHTPIYVRCVPLKIECDQLRVGEQAICVHLASAGPASSQRSPIPALVSKRPAIASPLITVRAPPGHVATRLSRGRARPAQANSGP